MTLVVCCKTVDCEFQWINTAEPLLHWDLLIRAVKWSAFLLSFMILLTTRVNKRWIFPICYRLCYSHLSMIWIMISLQSDFCIQTCTLNNSQGLNMEAHYLTISQGNLSKTCNFRWHGQKLKWSNCTPVFLRKWQMESCTWWWCIEVIKAVSYF